MQREEEDCCHVELICEVKERGGKKIRVQKEAVKRRKVSNGSKSAIKKGMTERKNPFDHPEPNVKRPYSFSSNVQQNQAVSKKAGRTMASKTKFVARSSSTS